MDEADVQSIVKFLDDDWTKPFDPNESVCQHFHRYPGPSRCSNGHPWCAHIWHGSIRGIQARPASRRKTKGSVLRQDNEEQAEDLFRYPKEDFYKQLKTTSFYKLTGIYLPTLSWWQRAAISIAIGARRLKRDTETDEKAALARELENQVIPAETIHEPSATIIDGMSLVHKMKGNDQTFSQLADSALTHIIREGVRSHRIDVLFDTHLEKSQSRTQRDRAGGSLQE